MPPTLVSQRLLAGSQEYGPIFLDFLYELSTEDDSNWSGVFSYMFSCGGQGSPAHPSCLSGWPPRSPSAPPSRAPGSTGAATATAMGVPLREGQGASEGAPQGRIVVPNQRATADLCARSIIQQRNLRVRVVGHLLGGQGRPFGCQSAQHDVASVNDWLPLVPAQRLQVCVIVRVRAPPLHIASTVVRPRMQGDTSSTAGGRAGDGLGGVRLS